MPDLTCPVCGGDLPAAFPNDCEDCGYRRDQDPLLQTPAHKAKRAMERCARQGWIAPEHVEAAAVEVLGEFDPRPPGITIVKAQPDA
ncbi:MAG: hypothetical protein JWM47_4510 [Acidimicrobiales bacterium]|nr:hypothetical protein [Acidimicrobiales bacterium]